MTTLRQAAQAALEALESVLCDPEGKAGIRGSDADNAIIDAALDALRAALAEPQPEPMATEFHNPWRASLENCISGDNNLRSNEYHELIKELDDLYRMRLAAPQAQPEPAAQSRTIREIICYIRENDLGSIGDEWIAALQVPQPDPKCSLGCTTGCKAKEHGCASECPALPWQPQAQQPLREGEVMGAYMDFDRTADHAWSNAEYLTRFGLYISKRTVERAHKIGAKP